MISTVGERPALGTRIGFDRYTIEHRGLGPHEIVEFARTHSFDGVQFLEPAVIDAELDCGQLADFSTQVDAMGLYLEVGLPCPNPFRRARQLGRDVAPVEWARDLRRHVEGVAALGCGHARVYVGDRHDRFKNDAPWPAQIDATVEVLRLLSGQLADLKIKVAIETHGDLTARELIAMLDRVGRDVAAVTLDTGNLVMRLDDPIEAAALLAPSVVATHVKDAVLAFTPRGLCWQARPVGSGIIPIPDILAAVIQANPSLTLSIELHPRTYDLPIFDRKWLAYFPGLRPESLAEVVRLAARCESRYADGTLPRPEVVEAIPWVSRDLDWLASSLGYLRSVVPTLAGI
jgi:sugar phosphate isomerase/epimerase